MLALRTDRVPWKPECFCLYLRPDREGRAVRTEAQSLSEFIVGIVALASRGSRMCLIRLVYCAR